MAVKTAYLTTKGRKKAAVAAYNHPNKKCSINKVSGVITYPGCLPDLLKLLVCLFFVVLKAANTKMEKDKEWLQDIWKIFALPVCSSGL